MGISQQIEAVYQRALLLRQRATALPVQPDLLNEALRELYFVLEELQAADTELQRQNQSLIDAQQQIEVERQRYHTLFELAPDGYLVTDRRGNIHHANRAAAALFDVDPAYLVHKPLVVLVEPDDRAKVSARLALPQGTEPFDIELNRRQLPPLAVAVTTAAVGNAQGQSEAMLWSLRDITQRQQAEAVIRHQAFYDALTGLPNRMLFDDRLPLALAQAQRQQDQLAVVFLDLDRFKMVNDVLGHRVGDEVLREVGTRLQSCLRSQDTVARWGGDEFTLILPSVESPEAVALTCDRIIASLEPAFTLREHTLQISISFGIALFPQDSDDPETLLRYADIALYQAKTQNCGYWFYNASVGLAGSRDRRRTRLDGELQ
ncbi:diguanylate cyclase domain-containing protein [Nodosilinea nodulosa]|uniref:diguanylate cyclase domain-containing protein n=1 Tax=Nodosilinea nodulosa TaxID=416001 RepID=UPI0002EF7134|nr:diguanylate cyclase [Nodosilinea nodulosa]